MLRCVVIYLLLLLAGTKTFSQKVVNSESCAKIKGDSIDRSIIVLGLGEDSANCSTSEDDGTIAFPIATVNIEKQSVSFGIAVFAERSSRGVHALNYLYKGKPVSGKRIHNIAPELTTKKDQLNEFVIFDMSAAAFSHFASQTLNATLTNKRATFKINIPPSTFSDVLKITSELTKDIPTTTSSQNKTSDAYAVGTGFFVSKNGFILTAAHLIKDQKQIRVFDAIGNAHDAKVVQVSKNDDVALLKINASTPNFLSVADSKDIELGTRVYTLGFPASQILGTGLKYSDGSISSIVGEANAKNMFQISVPVHPGNSGGPLLTEAGHVIGIVVGEISSISFFETIGAFPQNINFALKSAYIIPLLPSEVSISKRNQLIRDTQKAIVRIQVEGGPDTSH